MADIPIPEVYVKLEVDSDKLEAFRQTAERFRKATQEMHSASEAFESAMRKMRDGFVVKKIDDPDKSEPLEADVPEYD